MPQNRLFRPSTKCRDDGGRARYVSREKTFERKCGQRVRDRERQLARNQRFGRGSKRGDQRNGQRTVRAITSLACSVVCFCSFSRGNSDCDCRSAASIDISTQTTVGKKPRGNKRETVTPLRRPSLRPSVRPSVWSGSSKTPLGCYTWMDRIDGRTDGGADGRGVSGVVSSSAAGG